MINAGTVLNLVDNTGILKARCIKVYGNTKKKYEIYVNDVLNIVSIFYMRKPKGLFYLRHRLTSFERKNIEPLSSNSNDDFNNVYKIYVGVSLKKLYKLNSLILKLTSSFRKDDIEICEEDVKRIALLSIHPFLVGFSLDTNGKLLSIILQCLTTKSKSWAYDDMGRTKVDNTYVHTIYKDGKPVIFNEEYFEPLSEIFDDLMPVDDPKIKEADENTAKGSICYYYKKNVGENPNFDILNKFFEQKYKDGYHFNNEIKDVDQELTLKIKPRGIND